MEIVIRNVLGHLRDPDGRLSLFVDAELDGTFSGSCQLKLTAPATLQALQALIEDGIRARRLRHDGTAASFEAAPGDEPGLFWGAAATLWVS